MANCYTWILYCIAVVLHFSTIDAIICHNNAGIHESGTCVSSNILLSGQGACIIYRHRSGKLIQQCDNRFTTVYTCEEKGFEVNGPENTIEYQLCCNTNLCNSEEVFNSSIAVYEESIATSTTSVTPSSTTTTTTSMYYTPSTSLSSIFTSSAITTTTPTLSTASSSSSSSSSIPPMSSTDASISLSSRALMIILIVCMLSIGIVILVVTGIIVIFCRFYYPRHVVGIAVPTESDGTPTISTSGEFSSDPTEGTTSGSGSGLPLLIQRSVAAQVTLHNLIGKGRFGEVWRGSYRGDDIAVKIFHTKEEASWFHEMDIYQTCLIRHPNILRFVAADNKDVGIATQLWLITEYCELGSLYELLQKEELDESIMLKLLCTAASGLAHLHAEITGTEGKPGIAHRDLKTRNLLVKGDYTCCVADLGLALRYDKAADKVEELSTKRVGTRRYLSPEILDDSLDSKNFDCFKRSDMYSFGLVMWEVSRRGLCAGHAEEYQLPYFELLTPDPSFEEVKRVVSDEQKRPGIPNRWSQSETFNSLTQIMEQCWHHNSEARLTALRVKKSLINLQGKTKHNN